MNDTPSIEVIRHWIGWENDEFSQERVEQFHAWYAENEKRVSDIARLQEQERIVFLLEQMTTNNLTEVGGYVTFPRYTTASIIEKIRKLDNE